MHLLNPGVDYKQLEGKDQKYFLGFKGIEFEELQLCPMKNIYLNFNGKNDYIVALDPLWPDRIIHTYHVCFQLY